MGEIVNLRTAKKAKALQEAKQTARENRARHGRSSAEKANDRREAQRAAAALDAKRRDDSTQG